jgi:hypothetical protein
MGTGSMRSSFLLIAVSALVIATRGVAVAISE